MIEVDGLTKRYGPTVAVDGLTFSVQPGHVTGFLGPNGFRAMAKLAARDRAQMVIVAHETGLAQTGRRPDHRP